MYVHHGNRLLRLAWTVVEEITCYRRDGCERAGHFAGETIRKHRAVVKSRGVDAFGVNPGDRSQVERIWRIKAASSTLFMTAYPQHMPAFHDGLLPVPFG